DNGFVAGYRLPRDGVRRANRILGIADVDSVYQDIDRSSAGETDLPCLVIVERDRQHASTTVPEQRICGLDDLRVDTPADRNAAEQSPAFSDDHLRADFLRRAARRGHERRDGNRRLIGDQWFTWIDQTVRHTESRIPFTLESRPRRAARPATDAESR